MRIEESSSPPNGSLRLLLREIGIDDAGAVHAIYGNPEATEHLSFEPRTRERVGRTVAHSMITATATPRDELGVGDRSGHVPVLGPALRSVGGGGGG